MKVQWLTVLCFLGLESIWPAHALGQTNPPVMELNGVKLEMTRENLEEELILGRATAAQVLGASPLVKNRKLQKYVNKVGAYVAAQAKRKDLTWRFAVIDTSAVNAFAAPGGWIMITAGLIENLQSEDELAAVLGHEIAHVERKHHYRVMRQQKMLQFVNGAVKIEGADEANKLALLSAQVLARGLDKKAELQADRDGMVYAARAGYDASALYAVLERLSTIHHREDFSLLTTTHPSFEDRAEAIAAITSSKLQDLAKPSAAAPRLISHLK